MRQNKKRIAVIFGGCSEEYEVSLDSAYSVITNLNRELYEVIMLGITKTGNWYLYEGGLERIKEDAWQGENCIEAIISPGREVHGLIVFGKNGNRRISIDAAFPVLHGKNGEDGSIQGILEMAGIPIVGCGVISSALCMDKARAHGLVEMAGVEIPNGIVINNRDDMDDAMEIIKDFRFPLFVKPVRGGSSLGMSRVVEGSEVRKAVDKAFIHDCKVLVEEGISGFEVGCGIIGNEILEVSNPDEIELFVDFFDFHEKYTQHHSKIHFPARIEPELQEKVRQTAKVIYKALGCGVFARVDMFLTPDGRVIFNEVNTIPGLTTHSRYPSMVKGMGFSYGEMLDKLIALSI